MEKKKNDLQSFYLKYIVAVRSSLVPLEKILHSVPC